MLQETETEETIGFLVTFLSLVAFQLEGPGPPGYTYARPQTPVRNTLIAPIRFSRLLS